MYICYIYLYNASTSNDNTREYNNKRGLSHSLLENNIIVRVSFILHYDCGFLEANF